MIYRIEKDDFRMDLELNKWCDNEPGNEYISCDLTLQVACDGFCGHTTIDFTTEDFQIFLDELQNLKETLTGKVELKEPYCEDTFLKFEGDGRGHIHISGCITNMGRDWTQELNFENEIDQTCLPMQQVCE